MTLKEIKAVSKEDKIKRLEWYENKIAKTDKGKHYTVQALHLKAPCRYLLLSTSSLYECDEIEVLGFNKLNGDWQFNPNNNQLTHLAIPQSYRDFTDRRDTDTYPIANQPNGVDGVSQGLYAVVCKCLEYNDTKNYLLWISDGKSRLVDLRNNCSFQIYRLK